MDALEVRVARVVAGLDERLKARLHQCAHAAAEHGLLAKEVGFGFGAERGFKHARARAADAQRVGEADIQRIAGGVLFHCDQAGHALAGLVFAAHGVAGALGRDHDDVDVLGRLDAAEMDVEAVREGERLALGQVRLDALLVQLGLLFVVDEDHDDVGRLGCVGGGHDGQPRLLGLCPALAAVVEANDDLDAGVAQVQRVRVPLGAVADDGDRLSIELVQIAILLVVDVCHDKDLLP